MARRPAPLRLLLWRARVPLTVLGLLAGGAIVLDALRPAPEPHVTVLVAARALEAGTTLTAEQLRPVSWPARLAPPTPDTAQGRVLAVPVPEGTPLVEGVLAPEDRWAQAPPGTVAAPVRLADAELAALLRPGDRVDVLATAPGDGSVTRVARAALVLPLPVPRQEDGGLLDLSGPGTPSGLVLLAVTPAEGRALAARGAADVLSVVLVP